jgi:MATE family multidrug resistance protein
MCIEGTAAQPPLQQGPVAAGRTPASWSSAYEELRAQMKTSIPAMIGMLIYKIPWLLSLRFAGNIGSQELAAAALATTICNVTGMSLSVGLSSAMSTLTGQARGQAAATQSSSDSQKQQEQQLLLLSVVGKETSGYNATSDLGGDSLTIEGTRPILPMVFLYRGTFIQLLFVLPVGIWWLFGVENFLLSLGQGAVLSHMTAQYLRILTPGLWCYSVNWTITAWVQSIEMADVPAYAAAVSLVLHVPLNLLFIHVFGWGYLGVGAATVVTQTIQPAYEIYYLFLTRRGRQRVLENTMAIAVGRTRLTFWLEAKLAVKSLPGIMQYLSLALPGIVIISEWWASEICIFLAGTLIPHPDLALDGMTIYQSVNSFCFMFPVGCSVAGSARVGNFLGASDTRGADLAAKVSVVSATILSVAMGSILYLTPHTVIPSFFTPDQAVVEEASRLIPLLSIYVIGDGIQTALNGVIKGCGRQCIIMPIVVVAYWMAGVPLAYYFTFIRNEGIMCEDSILCGVTGLVSGLTIGTWTHMLLLATVVVCTTNWTIEARKAKERLEGGDNDGAAIARASAASTIIEVSGISALKI